MKQKAVVLQNRGMNRDLSVSKIDKSSAYENYNIRILARDHDTAVSVTNERGNIPMPFKNNIPDNINGTLIGWNVLNEHLILFTHEGKTDRIYRIDQDADGYINVTTGNKNCLFEGNLKFDEDHPIESIVYLESDKVKKIYWVDGKNVLRFMNFMAENSVREAWTDESFDTNKSAALDVQVNIAKDNSGNTRSNGVIQYFLTYYNQFGQETGFVWASDLVYLSPTERGGESDGQNNNKVTLTFSNLDTKGYDHFRVYALFRSSENVTQVGYLISDNKTYNTKVIVVDDGAHAEAIDYTKLLYVGSQPVVAGTLTHKDQTLFLGNLHSIGRDYTELEGILRQYMFKPVAEGEQPWESNCITFEYSGVSGVDEVKDIDYQYIEDGYSYDNQLKYTSSEILSFKGGEKYRFGLKFKLKDGTETDAFWIGDAENTKYPAIDKQANKIKRIVAKCNIPNEVVAYISNSTLGITGMQLTIAEATYADRAIKAQGIVNPTVFNVWERYNNREYSYPSWVARPRRGGITYDHLEAIKKSTSSTGEILCNYWEGNQVKTAYYTTDSGGEVIYDDDETPAVVSLYYMIIHDCERRIQNNKWVTTIHSSFFWIEQLGNIDDGDNIAARSTHLNIPSDVVDNREYTLAELPNKYRIKFVRVSYSDKAYDKPYDEVASIYIENLGRQLVKYGLSYDTYVANTTTLKDLIGFYSRYYYNFNTPVYINSKFYFHYQYTIFVENPGQWYTSLESAANYGVFPNGSADRTSDYWLHTNRWTVSGDSAVAYTPAYLKKHLMFVDENVVTLDSPEINEEALWFDSADYTILKFRIVGAARITSQEADFELLTTGGIKSIDNLSSSTYKIIRNKPNGLTAWPLWTDYALKLKTDEQGNPPEDRPEDPKDYTINDYELDKTKTVRYWQHMWTRSGIITCYQRDDEEVSERGVELQHKVFANLHYSPSTIYTGMEHFCNYPQPVAEGSSDTVDIDIRLYNGVNNSLIAINVGNDRQYHKDYVELMLDVPDTVKYPLPYTDGHFSDTIFIDEDDAFLYSSDPVMINYRSGAHAIISLGAGEYDGFYYQNILPGLGGGSQLPDNAHLPWNPAKQCRINNSSWNILDIESDFDTLASDDKYLLIGEIYQEYGSGAEDTRYGGISESAVSMNRFIAAGPVYPVGTQTLWANQGDTYFQRWDDLRTKKFSDDAVNNMVDIVSAFIETHINIDGRYDKQRGIQQIASLDESTYGAINRVYSQKNNFVIKQDLPEKFNTDAYRSSITWTLSKKDLADIDEWTHITLANSLALDGDKGECQALRRFQNSIVAFQNKGIAEVLFNSRTQLSTTNGVPVEIANSGKVDGKRYLSNKYGCSNKWSIVEGKLGLYFMDNLNKALCVYGSEGINNLSDNKGFGVWFRNANLTAPWTPSAFENFVGFYDKVHSDVYMVKSETASGNETPAIVFNELLGEFTSFFDYGSVPMMTNFGEKFIAFKNNKLWLQNEGKYCNFFGQQKDFYVTYRTTPEPFADKIWTNVEYRADFYRVLDDEGKDVIPLEPNFTDEIGIYQANETFDYMRFWNEYQTTEDDESQYNLQPVKKFRIWRLAIPRAKKTDSNKYGLDRMRNPWLNLTFKKKYSGNNDPANKDLMQLHDIVVTYFE